MESDSILVGFFIFFSILHFLTTEPNHRTLQTYSRQTHPVNDSTFRGQGVMLGM